MTSLLVRDPLLATPFRVLDEMFRTSNGSRVTGFTPTLDVYEGPEDFLVLIDLPGVKSEDVNIEVNDHVLTISGTRAPAEVGEGKLLERPYGSFVRNLTLPKGVDSDKIAADYTDGVLELRIPKPAQAKPKRIAIGAAPQSVIEQ
jgi:HSP20 family protein